jgi:uncharacterized protein
VGSKAKQTTVTRLSESTAHRLQPHATLHWGSTELTLLPEGAVWCAAEQRLFLTDLHLGKTALFQQAGMPLPHGPDAETVQCLSQLVRDYCARSLVLLGDIFHAHSNCTQQAVDLLTQLHKELIPLEWIIIPGNHDRRVPWHQWCPWATILPEGSRLGQWQLFHHPPEEEGGDYLRLCGHLHPGIMLGSGRMSKLRAKCFWLRQGTLVLPAFGAFTGIDPIQRETGDKVWLISDTGSIASL